MATVHKIVLSLEGGSRSPTEVYWTKEESFDVAKVKAGTLISRRALLLGEGGLITGVRISARDDTASLAPLGASRFIPQNRAGPGGWISANPGLISVGQGVLSLQMRTNTEFNQKGSSYLSMAPLAVAVNQTEGFPGFDPGSDGDKVIGVWTDRYNPFKAYLQSGTEKWSMRTKSRNVPSGNNLIIGLDSTTLGTNELLKITVAGNQVTSYPVSAPVQIQGSRIFGSRRRPMDRTYRAGKVELVGGNTEITILCSDSSLVNEKWCAFGHAYPVSYGLTRINGVAEFDELVGGTHRRGNRPTVLHRGLPRIRALRA